MNYALIFKLLGNVMKYEAIFMLLPLFVSVLWGEETAVVFLAPIVLLAFGGLSLGLIKPRDSRFRSKEGLVAVALSWIVLSLFGSMPYALSGYFVSYIDCFFEAMSGFTTTGASILQDVEVLPKGLLLWRSFTVWIGGMGVLVFMLALMPSGNASSFILLRAESPGPVPGKLVPKIRESAKITYMIYFVLTILLFLTLVTAKMPLFDSVVHALSSAGTGGFSNRNFSIGAYQSLPVEVIISVFGLLFGVNFSLYFCLLRKDWRMFLKDEEFSFYIGIVVCATLFIGFNLFGSQIYHSLGTAFRYSFFQVSSIITSSGFSSADYNTWPLFSKLIIILLTLTGSCAGSTSGGFKLVRILLLIKFARIEINKLVHPREVRTVKLNGKNVDHGVMDKVFMFSLVYMVIFAVSVLIISLENKDMVTSFTSVLAMLSNVGPGLEVVGPVGSYAFYSGFSKLVLSFCMLAGRLEFFPVLALFIPSIWKRGVLN